MSHPVITLADAVVAELNAGTYSQSFTAERAYVPRFDADSGDVLQVQVVPRTDAEAEQTAGIDVREIVIQVGIFKRLVDPVAGEVAEIDALMDLCEEIRGELNRVRLGETDEAVCVATTHDPIYSMEDIDERRVFLTVLAFTFLVDVEV